jgi:hypothetical protein
VVEVVEGAPAGGDEHAAATARTATTNVRVTRAAYVGR